MDIEASFLPRVIGSDIEDSDQDVWCFICRLVNQVASVVDNSRRHISFLFCFFFYYSSSRRIIGLVNLVGIIIFFFLFYLFWFFYGYFCALRSLVVWGSPLTGSGFHVDLTVSTFVCDNVFPTLCPVTGNYLEVTVTRFSLTNRVWLNHTSFFTL